MPTNSVYENLFHGINEIPLFTYGMLSITTVVLAYFTLYDIESATGEEGADTAATTEPAESKEEEVQPEEQPEEQLVESEDTEQKEQESELTEEGTLGKPISETESKPQTDVLETITGSPVSELSNLTENISKSLSPNEAPVTNAASSPVKAAAPIANAVPETPTNVPVKPPVQGGHKKRKTKRSNKSAEKKKTRNNRKKLQKK